MRWQESKRSLGMTSILISAVLDCRRNRSWAREKLERFAS